MWHLTEVLVGLQIWFSDGLPYSATRGGHGVSSRITVDQKGFLDITEVRSVESIALDANGATLWMRKYDEETHPDCLSLQNSTAPLSISLKIEDDGSFKIGLSSFPEIVTACYQITDAVTGQLKPLPQISDEDAQFISELIEQKYVPYQNIPDAPLKTDAQIKALGEQFFPFTPHNYELAMSLYDYTTASFARMVFFKVFQYTGYDQVPRPLDEASLAHQIWKSDWPPYTPQDADYMRAYFMEPADSLENVTAQLSDVIGRLNHFALAQNRLFAAAVQSMPRNSIVSKPQLFSGQVDILQLGNDHFAVEFYECPLNHAPVGTELVLPLEDALDSYVSVGKTITTKMIWSFTDDLDAAMHYSNGIVLVMSPPADSWVWEDVAFITPLSDDDLKIEYTFAPDTEFVITSVDKTVIANETLTVIGLEPARTRSKQAPFAGSTHLEVLMEQQKGDDVVRLLQEQPRSGLVPHGKNRTSGRRCACNRH